MPGVIAYMTDACRAFAAHWHALPRRGTLPHCSDFLDAAPLSLMPLVMLYEIHPEGFLLRFVGTRLVEQWRHDRTGTMMAFGRHPALAGEVRQMTGLLLETPCGIRHLGAMQTNLNRRLECETLTLPLGVDDGKPPRLARCCMILESLQRDEALTGFGAEAKRQWIDLGRGIPALSAELMP